MRGMLRTAVAVSIFLGGGACKPPNHDMVLDASGYSHQDYGLTVAPGAGGGVLSGVWHLDNLYRKGNRYRPKKGEYEVEYSFDVDGDGRYESKKRMHAYELRYEHLKNGATLWLRVIPISKSYGLREPRVLLREYVQNIARAGYEANTMATGETVVVEQRFAPEVLVEYSGTLAGAPAHAMTLNVVNIDQIKVVRTAKAQRVRLVLARIPGHFEYRPMKGRSASFPLVLVAGYSSLPEYFDSLAPEFDDFLGRIGVSGERGVRLAKIDGGARTAGATVPSASASGRKPGASNVVESGETNEDQEPTTAPTVDAGATNELPAR